MAGATFGGRVREAREFARLSQADLAKKIGVKQQAIEYLENPRNNAQGSKHTSEIARVCGVDSGWLAKGKGPAPGKTAQQPVAQYGTTLSDQALELARLWSDLSPDVQTWIRDLVFVTHLAEKRYPWMRRGRPKSETYDEWERRQEQSFKAAVKLEIDRNESKVRFGAAKPKAR